MKRLVYSPKAYVFIRSSNLDGKVFDVSNDVVRGTVTQNLGDVSKATFELRNRYQKWLRDPDSGNRSIFLPMDMVTIWLQRIAGRPVQVFTGYLDAVPYYQGYPGNAQFEATCTLKKLAFTWFDPGLSTFMQWVQTNDGWYFDPSSGEGLNAIAKGQGSTITGSAALDPSGTNSQINDTGFANLLGRFMTDIAGWSPDDVLISELPPDIPKQAAQLWSKIQSDTMQDIKSLEDYFKVTMGINGWSAPDPSTPTTAQGTPAQTTASQNLMARVRKVADQNNVPILVLSLASYVTTRYDESYSVDPTSGSWNWGYGMYALQPPTSASLTGSLGIPLGTDLLPVAPLIDNKYKPADVLDASVATQAFCDLLNAQQGPWVSGARTGDLNSIVTWIQKVLPSFQSDNMTTAFVTAKTAATVGPIVTTPTSAPSTGTGQVSFQSASVQSVASAADKATITARYANASPWLANFILRAKTVSRDLTLMPPPNTSSIAFTGPAGALTAFFSKLKGDPSIDSVAMMLPGANKSQVLSQGVVSNLPPSPAPSGSTIVIAQANDPGASNATPTSGSSSASGSASTTAAGGVSIQQLATFSANAAFAANFAFPTNVAESTLLTGDRALMNDVSCMDGYKQFCQASLRTFRSLPDGRVLAFYPDYFGAYRKPYWSIYNIELTDFGIQLNDDSLATHVYVVGDTFAGDGQITMEDDVSTRGVATLTQAFMLNSFIEPYSDVKDDTTPPSIGRLQDAYSFLKHYGARPHKEEQPLIRNTFYEFLLAWQKFMYLWSQQFATNVSFTFQPEVMAGGLIAFPDHGVQMFCESVTHSWDYSSGFGTTAVMTAPSLINGSNVDRTHKPGFALGGNINTVGVE